VKNDYYSSDGSYNPPKGNHSLQYNEKQLSGNVYFKKDDTGKYTSTSNRDYK